MAWTTPVDWTVGQLLSAADLNKVNANLNALKSPPSDLKKGNGSTAITTSSTSYVDVLAALNINFITNGGPVMIGFTGYIATGASNTCYLDVEVDGVQLGTGSLIYLVSIGTPIAFTTLTSALTANVNHTFILRWKSTAGTTTLTNTANNAPIFWAREVS